MDAITFFLNSYFDIVFARTGDAQAWLAIIYTLISFGALYLFFAVPSYTLFSRLPHQYQLNHRSLEKKQIKNEITASVQSILMFGVLAGGAFYLFKFEILKVAGDISLQQWLLEILILYCWNELHFYFGHRLLHTSWLYKRVHIQHHRSIRVTPFACWRFHWLESLILGSVLPLSLVFFEFSVWSLVMLPIISIIWNIIGHSNWKTTVPFLGRASESHALHHSQFYGNYGFSTPILDMLLRTKINT